MTDGNAAQTRVIAEQVAETAIARFYADHPTLKRKEADIPAPLKWASVIIAALFTLGVTGMAGWLVTSVNEMQVTLARMDERMSNQGSAQDDRFSDLDRRVTILEGFHNGTRR